MINSLETLNITNVHAALKKTISEVISVTTTTLSNTVNLKLAYLATPLGPMITIADDQALYLLEFIDKPDLTLEILKLVKKTNACLSEGSSAPLKLIEQELKKYFAGELKQFKTPLNYIGTPFQKRVWQALLTIPYGKTCSYADIAKVIGKPTAFRAVANANGANQLAIIIPCHRVIQTNGDLGGYSGGVNRKQWMIQHEAQ
jgi:AraC family transcriptional regulator of adaptative response/methylated-DNA-[protein]-cysteine methyltransferase